jgi:hypothetical protein
LFDFLVLPWLTASGPRRYDMHCDTIHIAGTTVMRLLAASLGLILDLDLGLIGRARRVS